MTKHKKNKNSGITLIALVITIIVLLILAGISIMMLSGNNGILKRAGEAKEKTVIGQEQEFVNLAHTSAYVNQNSQNRHEFLQEELDKLAGEGKTTVIDNKNDTYTVLFAETNHDYLISFKENEHLREDLYLIKNGIDQKTVTGGWGHYSYTASGSNMAGFMKWEDGYLSFGEDNTMNDCHNPYTKKLIELNKYKFICIDYEIPVNTLAGNPTTYYGSFMEICFDKSISANGSIKCKHDYHLAKTERILNGKEKVERKITKLDISKFSDQKLSLSFCGWVSPNIQQLEVRVYNLFLSDK